MSDRADMLGRAAQAWCTADTQDIEMNPALAEAFADILAADLAAAEERGRREALSALRKKMTYDETASKGSWGWGLITRTYSIDADIFDALLEKEDGE